MKFWTIALKDTLTSFRDRNAIFLMIIAPLMVGLIMGAAFGNLDSNSSPISEIPLIIVNLDEGELGETFVDILASIDVDTVEGKRSLFTASQMKSKSEAISKIELGEVRGLIFIPSNFTKELEARNDEKENIQVEIYTDPSASISPAIIRGVVQRIVDGFNTVMIGDIVAVEQLKNHLDENTSPKVYAHLENLEEIIAAENTAFGENEGASGRITVELRTLGESEDFDYLGYFVPSMSIFFLSFAAFEGTRSILEEESGGTLHRLMTTPTSIREILFGKISGTFLTGILQFTVLVAASALLFHVHWSDNFLALVLLTIATVFAMTSFGALLASFARNSNQANILGTTMSLIFAAIGGNFLPTTAFPSWLTVISKLTINRWALDGFVNLALSHATFAETLPKIGVLSGMATLYFSLAALLFTRRFVK